MRATGVACRGEQVGRGRVASERTIEPNFGHARGHERATPVPRYAPELEPAAITASTYLAALSAASDGVLLLSRAGVIVYANPAAEAYFSPACLVGQYFSDLSRLERRTLSDIWRQLQRAGRWCGPLGLRASNPDLDVTVQRVPSEEPNLTQHYCVVLHGAGRAEPSHTRSALQRVASEIAHDFNNQITVILNYTFVLLRHIPADSPLKTHITEMQAAAWRASQVAQAIHRALVTHTLVPSVPSGK